MRKLAACFIVFISFIAVPSALFADVIDQSGSQPPAEKITVIAELHELISTHTTYFRGGTLLISYPVSPKFSLGLGAEYSYVGFHFDNGYDLTHFKLMPVFIDSRITFSNGKKFVPFFRLSPGITFDSYIKQDDKKQPPTPPSSSPLPYQVKDTGLYVYAGAGGTYKINNYFGLIAEAGFKGYHMTFNNLDINPHGLVFGLGLAF